MKDEIISYREMCDRENVQTLQRGMNFRLNRNYSVILMSQRKNAPYNDKIFDDGFTIEYEGHDIPKKDGIKIQNQLTNQEIQKLVNSLKMDYLLNQLRIINQKNLSQNL